MNIVVAESLSKHYGSFRALDDCSLEVQEGCVFGLLGPNGAGKTTLIRTLLGYIRPTSGAAKIRGFDCFTESVSVRKNVGYLPAEAKLFRTMKGTAVLEFFAAMHPLGNHVKAVELAKRLQLDLTRRVAFMSTGMKQKLALAAVVSCAAPLLILDEPTANLDPTVRNEIMSLIRETHTEGRTVILCSHVLQEIEEVCQDAAILRAGKVVHRVDVEHLRSVHRIQGEWNRPEPFESMARPNQVIHNHCRDGKLVIDIEGPLEDHWNWLRELDLRNVKVEPVGLRSIYETYHSSGAT